MQALGVVMNKEILHLKECEPWFNHNNQGLYKLILVLIILATLIVCPLSILAAEKSADISTEDTIDETIEKAAEKAAEKATQKTVEQFVEKAVEKAAKKATEIRIKKAVEKAVKKAAGKPLKQEVRPEKWRGLTKVRFFIFVIDIDNIDGSAQSFSANFHISLSWKDARLALANKAEPARLIPLEKIWSPRIVLVNQGGNVWESLPRVAEVMPDGTVTYRQRFVGPLSQPLLLTDFPMDEHHFNIQLATAGQGSQGVEFIPSEKSGFRGGTMSDKLSLTDWEITNFEATAHPYKPINEYSLPGFSFEFTAKRYFPYYLWQVVLPLSLIVMMSFAVHWINRTNTSAQIGLATSAILALITYRFVLAGLLPKLPYMTTMDYFTLGSTLLVFLSLIMVIITDALSRRKQDKLVQKIDKCSRLAFPGIFLFMLGWFLSKWLWTL